MERAKQISKSFCNNANRCLLLSVQMADIVLNVNVHVFVIAWKERTNTLLHKRKTDSNPFDFKILSSCYAASFSIS